MKLTANIQISVDGVTQANGGRNERFDPDFERGGWARALFDEQSMAYVNDVYSRADSFLLGRRTYELFASYWGGRDDLDNPIVGALNRRPKYVVSGSLAEADWDGTTVVRPDVDAIRRLKATPGGEL